MAPLRGVRQAMAEGAQRHRGGVLQEVLGASAGCEAEEFRETCGSGKNRWEEEGADGRIWDRARREGACRISPILFSPEMVNAIFAGRQTKE